MSSWGVGGEGGDVSSGLGREQSAGISFRSCCFAHVMLSQCAKVVVVDLSVDSISMFKDRQNLHSSSSDQRRSPAHNQ